MKVSLVHLLYFPLLCSLTAFVILDTSTMLHHEAVQNTRTAQQRYHQLSESWEEYFQFKRNFLPISVLTFAAYFKNLLFVLKIETLSL